MEATTGFEPVNRGFADPRLNHLASVPIDNMSIPISNLPHFNHWLNSLMGRGYSPRTISLYGYRVKHILEPNPKSTQFELEDYFARMVIGGKSASHRRNCFKALKNYFTYLHRHNLIAENPMNEIEPPSSERVIREPANLTDVKAVLKYCEDRPSQYRKLHLMLMLLLDTGIRVFEAVTIKLENIGQGEIKVFGKSSPRKGPKIRIVPISPATIKLLGDYVRVDLPMLQHRYGNTSYIFPNGNCRGHWRQAEVRAGISRLCIRVGVPVFTPHQVRHTFATEMLNRGGEMRMVSRLLGHSDIGITDRIYGKVTEAQLKAQHARYSPLAEADREGQPIEKLG